jgi:hypothetical protein
MSLIARLAVSVTLWQLAFANTGAYRPQQVLQAHIVGVSGAEPVPYPRAVGRAARHQV